MDSRRSPTEPNSFWKIGRSCEANMNHVPRLLLHGEVHFSREPCRCKLCLTLLPFPCPALSTALAYINRWLLTKIRGKTDFPTINRQCYPTSNYEQASSSSRCLDSQVLTNTTIRSLLPSPLKQRYDNPHAYVLLLLLLLLLILCWVLRSCFCLAWWRIDCSVWCWMTLFFFSFAKFDWMIMWCGFWSDDKLGKLKLISSFSCIWMPAVSW